MSLYSPVSGEVFLNGEAHFSSDEELEARPRPFFAFLSSTVSVFSLVRSDGEGSFGLGGATVAGTGALLA